MNAAAPMTGFLRMVGGMRAPATATVTAAADATASFEALLRRTSAREAATQLVSSVFVVPVLQSLREGVFASDGPFAPGPAERRFAPLLDEKLADHIVRAARWPLVDRIVERLA